jgi:uncharacterized membrane protein
VLVGLIVLTFPAYKALRHPGMITGHDTEAAVVKAQEFYNALRDGNFPPRWAKRLDYGLGQPTFVFTYSLPYYLMAVAILANAGPIWAFKLVMAVSFPAGAFFAFLWLKRHVKFWPALLAALVYAYMPYRFVNVYVRGAIGEVVAGVFVPLAFWGLDRVVEKPKLGRIGIAALIISAVVLSHPTYGLICFGVWLSYVLVHKEKRATVTAVVWGYINCAFYLVPAMLYKNLTFLDKLGEYFVEKQNFVTLYRLITPTWGFSGAHDLTHDPMSVQIGVVGLMLSVVWVGLLLWSHKFRKQSYFKLSVLFAVLTVFFVVMMLRISLPVWKVLPFLQSVQFPWRLLFFVNLGITYCAATVFDHVDLDKKYLVAGILAIVIICVNRSYWNVGRYFQFEDKTAKAIGYPGTLTLLLEETPKWHDLRQEANPYNYIQSAAGKAISLASVVWKTNYHEFEVVTDQPVYINDKTHYWPGWKVWVDGVEVEVLNPYNSLSHGLITFPVGPGKHIVVARLTEPWVNKLANLVSLAMILAAIGGVVLVI